MTGAFLHFDARPFYTSAGAHNHCPANQINKCPTPLHQGLSHHTQTHIIAWHRPVQRRVVQADGCVQMPSLVVLTHQLVADSVLLYARTSQLPGMNRVSTMEHSQCGCIVIVFFFSIRKTEVRARQPKINSLQQAGRAQGQQQTNTRCSRQCSKL